MSTASSAEGQRRGPLVRALVELARLPQHTTDRCDLLARAADICRQALPDTAVATSIGVGDPARPTTVCDGAACAATLENAQLSSGEGPCPDAWRTGRTVHSRDVCADHRWPTLRGVLDADQRYAVVAVPLLLADRVVGVLGVYGDASLVEPETVEDAGLLASAVTALLHQADATERLEATARQLRTALESRATIEQAKGVVMAIRGCGADEAFEILAEVSSSANIKLRDLAARMVEKASQGIDNLPDQRRDGGRYRGQAPPEPPSS